MVVVTVCWWQCPGGVGGCQCKLVVMVVAVCWWQWVVAVAIHWRTSGSGVAAGGGQSGGGHVAALRMCQSVESISKM